MPVRQELGEFSFIEAIRRTASLLGPSRGIRIGIGDDAALVSTTEATLLTVDAMVEGIHFRRDWLSAAELGRRAFRAAASDIAAMGGRPRYVVLAVGIPVGLHAAYARRMVRGLVVDARAANTSLVGGNVTRSPMLSLTVTVAGEPTRRVLRRDRARPGQPVLVTGFLGQASAGVARLRRGHRAGSLVNAYRTPPSRLSLARELADCGRVAAMIDVSDGLVQDLTHVCRASGVRARLDVGAVPLSRALRSFTRDPLRYALGGGDDYELLFTATSMHAVAQIQAIGASHGCRVSRIGAIEPRRGAAVVIDQDGEPLTGGYAHF